MLILLCALWLLPILCQDDPCRLPTSHKHWYGNVSSLRRCFQSIKLDLVNARSMLAVMRRVADMYAFTERAAVSASSTDSEYALDARLLDGLAEVENLLDRAGDNFSAGTPLHSEFEFQGALAALLHQMRDGNTQFRLSKGFSAVVYRPYMLSAHPNGNALMFRLRRSPYHDFLAPLFMEEFAFDVDKFVGREVLGIDGAAPLEYLEQFGEDFIGKFKHPSARFNAALSGDLCHWGAIDLQLYGFNMDLLRDSMTLTLGGASPTDTQIITLPQLAYSKLPGSLSTLLIEKWNAFQESEDAGNNGTAFPANVNDNERIGQKRDAELIQVRLGSKQQGVMLMLDDAAPQNYILKIFAFNDPLANLTRYYELANQIFNQLSTQKVDSLIIDVSGNSGGDVCIVQAMLSSLVAEWSGYSIDYSTVVWERKDIKVSNFLRELHSENRIHPSYGSPTTRELFAHPNQYFELQRPVEIVNVTQNFTGLFYSPFPASSCQSKLSGLSLPFLASLRKLIVLTDGLCKGACSYFVNKLTANKNAFIIAYGGLPGRGMEVSYASGDPITYTEANDLLKSRGPAMNNSAQIAFTLFQTYLDEAAAGPNSSGENENTIVPREFRPVAPDMVLPDHFAPLLNNDPGTLGERMDDFTALYGAAKRVFVDWPGEFSTARLRPRKTAEPTSQPTGEPSAAPTSNATDSPTANATDAPTDTIVLPSDSPTAPLEPTPPPPPTEAPTPSPSAAPTASRAPTGRPTAVPTANASNTTAPTDGDRINFPLSWLLFGLAGICSLIFLVVIFGMTYYYKCRKVKEMQYHLIQQSPEDTLSLFPNVPTKGSRSTALEVDDSY